MKRVGVESAPGATPALGRHCRQVKGARATARLCGWGLCCAVLSCAGRERRPPGPPPEYEPPRVMPWDAGSPSEPEDPFAALATGEWLAELDAAAEPAPARNTMARASSGGCGGDGGLDGSEPVDTGRDATLASGGAPGQGGSTGR